MAQATIGALRVTLGLESAAFTDGITAAQKHLQSIGRQMQSVGQGIAVAGAGMTAAITTPFIALGAHLLQGSQDAAASAAQVNAALASMGDASGRTFAQLEQAAVGLRNLSGFDDDEILTKVTANLLTFGNVSGQVFDRAQVAALDLSARLKQDLQSSTLMVGKALNDPIQGLSALRRVGIQFTDQQEAQIRAMQGVGDMAGAQAIMLSELERQFGGAAAAAGKADVWLPLKTALMDLEGALEPLVREVIAPLIEKVAAIARAFANLSPQTQKVAFVAAALAAALGPVLVAVGAVVASVGVLLPLIGAIGAPFLLAAAAAAGLAAALYVFRDDIIPIVQSFGAALAEHVGPKLAPLWTALKGAVAAVGEVFSAVFGDGSPGGATTAIKFWGGVTAQVLGAALDVITGAIGAVTNIFRAFAALLQGDFSAMWAHLGRAVGAMASGVLQAFATLFPGVTDFARRTYEGVRDWLFSRFTQLVGRIGEAVGRVSGFFRDLYVAVVGNSYIPDLVREVGDWMGPRLQAALVDPALTAVNQTEAAFAGMTTEVSGQMDSLFRSIASRDWKGALGNVLGVMSGMGGPLGAIGKVGSAIAGLPGFKGGGSFTVGGRSGVDSNVVAFRATRGEMVDIRRPGQDNGPLAQHFHVNAQGAVLAEGLMAEMRQVGVQSAFVGADLGSAKAQSTMTRRANRRLG